MPFKTDKATRGFAGDQAYDIGDIKNRIRDAFTAIVRLDGV